MPTHGGHVKMLARGASRVRHGRAGPRDRLDGPLRSGRAVRRRQYRDAATRSDARGLVARWLLAGSGHLPPTPRTRMSPRDGAGLDPSGSARSAASRCSTSRTRSGVSAAESPDGCLVPSHPSTGEMVGSLRSGKHFEPPFRSRAIVFGRGCPLVRARTAAHQEGQEIKAHRHRRVARGRGDASPPYGPS